ncbi:signal peptidase I [Sutcliffiella rhizosphaerae]|uniref:Signal peptidase I n=1 Tax=Sutcliffiella rhizosphaerae TaxID=2880967 RepID=A0ABM8YNR3_9BACI|nr:signal peptidase I [Sutcliffiella rhizosphaerae]CAG9621569.1 Signal peptidase I T [Sutcliffiella rhizosphaerae]
MSLQNLQKEIFSWLKLCVIGLLVAVFISAFVIQPFTVKGNSMEPTLEGEDLWRNEKTGDHVLIFKSGYMVGMEAEYNDIVVIDSRIERERRLFDNLRESPLLTKLLNEGHGKNYWIKRVIGKEGDTLEYKDGIVYRNGEALVEDFLLEEMVTSFDKITVPKNHVFVLGDNRNNSRDSREIGAVPLENVMGKVVLRYYPFDRMDTPN